jgi:biopolymer transport protein ExbD
MRGKARTDFTQINITPLTDIFLVLVIIMMVIAPMLDSKGLMLAVPTTAPDKQVTEQPKVIRIEINASGSYTVDGQAATADSIQQRIYQLKKDHPDGIVIETDPKAKHGAVVAALDAARGAGVDKVAVQEAGADGGEAAQ